MSRYRKEGCNSLDIYLAVEVGFHSDEVECRTLNTADRVQSPVGAKCDLDYFSFPIIYLYETADELPVA